MKKQRLTHVWRQIMPTVQNQTEGQLAAIVQAPAWGQIRTRLRYLVQLRVRYRVRSRLDGQLIYHNESTAIPSRKQTTDV